jgi:hypothetical protein
MGPRGGYACKASPSSNLLDQFTALSKTMDHLAVVAADLASQVQAIEDVRTPALSGIALADAPHHNRKVPSVHRSSSATGRIE